MSRIQRRPPIPRAVWRVRSQSLFIMFSFVAEVRLFHVCDSLCWHRKFVFNRGVLPEMELAVLSVILVIYWHWDSVKKQLQYCMSIPRKYDWFVGYFVVYHLKMLHNKYIHVLNTCTHAAGFDARSIFHCCFAYRVEPRCPIDQIQINKEAVSKIEFHISLVSQERYCNQSIERYLFLGTPVLYWTEYIAGIGRYRRSQYMQWQLLSFKLVLCSWAR